MNVSLGLQLWSLREEIGRLHSEAPALSVTLDAPDEDLADLLAAVEVACYRIVTEALTNVTRHLRHALHGADRAKLQVADRAQAIVQARDAGLGQRSRI